MTRRRRGAVARDAGAGPGGLGCGAGVQTPNIWRHAKEKHGMETGGSACKGLQGNGIAAKMPRPRSSQGGAE